MNVCQAGEKNVRTKLVNWRFVADMPSLRPPWMVGTPIFHVALVKESAHESRLSRRC